MSDYDKWLTDSEIGKAVGRMEGRVPDQYRFFDFYGDEITYQQWTWLIDAGGAEYVTVDMEAINERYAVATMWSGMANIDDEFPALYCTYILHTDGDGDGFHADYEKPTETLEEARRVHAETVESTQEYMELRDAHPIEVVQGDLEDMVRGLMEAFESLEGDEEG